ncbi:energy-coupling factor transporter transmembrane component T family protein [Halegenticoccus tardaugens]|uniref:energy-coupling factor transporter transmembrane component T family protein n=1 Tax=Halegenticoccus tardaugens TaxID=2071624 RepID=UPI00100ADD17|nr:energy-coupling factor transporter transmembrane component T [Halegenticoccus tardaugens]
MDETIYQPGESVVHRLNPVTKIVVALCLSAIVFVIPDYRVSAILAVLLALLVAVAGVHRVVFKLVGALIVPFGAFLLVIQGILNPAHQTTPLVTVGPVTVWEAGFEAAVLITFRVLVLILSFLLMATTSPTQKMRVALMDKGVPNKLAYVFIASIQMIPQMRSRSKSITEAQQARGLDTEADLRTRLTSIVALLAPLLISTLVTANTRALALDARGFNSTNERTFLFKVPDPSVEKAIRWLAVAGVALAVVGRIVVWQ